MSDWIESFEDLRNRVCDMHDLTCKYKAELAAARAACGEALDAIIWLSGQGDLSGLGHWTMIREKVIPLLRDIAAGKEEHERAKLQDNRG